MLKWKKGRPRPNTCNNVHSFALKGWDFLRFAAGRGHCVTCVWCVNHLRNLNNLDSRPKNRDFRQFWRGGCSSLNLSNLSDRGVGLSEGGRRQRLSLNLSDRRPAGCGDQVTAVRGRVPAGNCRRVPWRTPHASASKQVFKLRPDPMRLDPS